MECSDKETDIKTKLREGGMNPDDYEGCGFIPTEGILKNLNKR